MKGIRIGYDYDHDYALRPLRHWCSSLAGCHAVDGDCPFGFRVGPLAASQSLPGYARVDQGAQRGRDQLMALGRRTCVLESGSLGAGRRVS